MNLLSAAVANRSSAPRQDRPWRRSRRRLARETAAPAVIPPGGIKTILMVGDTPVLRGVLAGVLRQLGYRVLQAHSAIEAQRLARDNPEIALLLLDLAAPGSGDVQLALWFSAAYPELPVV